MRGVMYGKRRRMIASSPSGASCNDTDLVIVFWLPSGASGLAGIFGLVLTSARKMAILTENR
jgi:hypothetical protein